ncbi:MAG: radical SAM protein [Candidatus Binatia bacterium]
MARLIIELTDRCNLRCRHCFDARHAGTGDLSLDILSKVLQEGKSCGFDEISFTGGEPTLHRQFAEIVRLVCAAGYRFGFVSNGSNFLHHYALLLEHREWLEGVTFSLDGARETTHDRLRGKGSYRQVVRAASICVFKGIPFTLNMVLSAESRSEVREMVELGASLGSRAVRFGHLMSTPETALRGLDLSPKERLEVEDEIWRLQGAAPILVAMAPGYFSESPFFPCAPLKLQELNLDCRGNVTLCCQLSGYSGADNKTDFMGNLSEVSLAEAVERSRRMVAVYLADKQAKLAGGRFAQLDHFPCWYCLKHLGKTSWLKNFPHHPWADNEGPTAPRTHDNA